MRHRVLVISLTELVADSRVIRQVDFLAPHFDVVVAAFGSEPELGQAEFLELPSQAPAFPRGNLETAFRLGLRTAGLYGAAYWRDSRVQRWRNLLAEALPVDAIVVNDLFVLPLARTLDSSVPLVFDAREHWTSESASWTKLQKISMRRAHEWIVDRYLPETAAMMTVSPGIARAFQERSGVRPHLVTNAPYFHSIEPSEVNEPIRLVHIGVADERRRLENTIDAVRSLDDRFRLDLVLTRRNEYRRRIENLVASDDRIRLLPPVPQGDLVSFANRYDVGVHLFPAKSPNQVYSLPNKLFDYIQARLAVAIGPSPEMANVVREWDCGIVSSSFSAEAFAESLRQLTLEDVDRMKRNADRAARVLTAENNRNTVVSVVKHAIGAGQNVSAPSPE